MREFAICLATVLLMLSSETGMAGEVGLRIERRSAGTEAEIHLEAWVGGEDGIDTIDFFASDGEALAPSPGGAGVWSLLDSGREVDPVTHTAETFDPLSAQRQMRIYTAADATLDGDGDGLSDGREALVWNTDPANPDSDFDDLPDGWETTHQLDPTDDGSGTITHGRSGDGDGDGLVNLEEMRLGLDPWIRQDVSDHNQPMLRVFTLLEERLTY